MKKNTRDFFWNVPKEPKPEAAQPVMPPPQILRTNNIVVPGNSKEKK